MHARAHTYLYSEYVDGWFHHHYSVNGLLATGSITISRSILLKCHKIKQKRPIFPI